MRLVSRLGLDAGELLEREKGRLVEEVERLAIERPVQCKELVLQVVNCAPLIILPHIIKRVEVLTDSNLLSVSVREHSIYLTAPGELYDRSVVDSLKAETKSGNVARENKAYSYKEQMEEEQLRKEIQKKKEKEGKVKAPELTPKQKEAMRVQLEKEAEVREKLTNLLASASPVLLLLGAIAESRPSSLALHLTGILPTLHKAVTSPIIANEVANILFSLRRTAFTAEDEGLAQVVAGVSLHVLKPAMAMSCSWSKQELKKSLAATLLKLHSSTVSMGDMMEEGEEDDTCPLSAPAFAYCFPLLRAAMLHHLDQEEVLGHGFDIISEHTGLRGEEGEEEDLFHPRLLPRASLIALLLRLTEETEGRTQQRAVSCLIDTAQCGGGGAGCARAGEREVDALLGALQSGNDAVRDASLRGLRAMVGVFNDLGDSTRCNTVRRVWVAKCDTSPENKELAEQLWDEAGLHVSPALCLEVMEDVAHPVEVVRRAAAEALAALLADDPRQAPDVLSALLVSYEEKLELSPAVMDENGRIVQEPIDFWEPRSGIALALAKLCPYHTPSMVKQVVSFLVPLGLADRKEVVRKHMLDAAVATIDLHGKDTVGDLLPVFEDFLDNAPEDSSLDIVRQSVVILMGSLARHLDKDDPKVRPIIGKLIQALATPSQQV